MKKSNLTAGLLIVGLPIAAYLLALSFSGGPTQRDTLAPEFPAIEQTSEDHELNPSIAVEENSAGSASVADEHSTDPARESTAGEPNADWQIDLSTSKVSIRALPALPDRALVELFDEKSSAALQGDSDAAFYLYYALKFCRNAPRSAEHYESDFLNLLTTRKMEGLAYADDTSGAERLLANQYAICDGVSEEQLSSANEFLRIASDSGLPEAQVLYAMTLINAIDEDTPVDEVDAAIKLMRAARDGGNVEAYFWLSLFGMNGFIEADSQSIVADLIVAQAAYSKSDIKMNLEKMIEQEFDRLYPREREEAIRLAQERAAGSRCCSYAYGKSWKDILREDTE